MEPTFDLMYQNASAPVVLNGLPDIKKSFLDLFAFGNNRNVMPPWNGGYLFNNLLLKLANGLLVF
jgi:hypothetical protein